MITKEQNSKEEEKTMGEKSNVIEEKILMPLADVYTNENEVSIESEMAGINKDSLDITLDDNLLTIRGSRSERETDGYKLQYAEFYPSSFKRQFRMEGSVDFEKVKASMNNGLLKLRIPFKKASVKKIAVLAG